MCMAWHQCHHVCGMLPRVRYANTCVVIYHVHDVLPLVR
jgi:hypothetical protein